MHEDSDYAVDRACFGAPNLGLPEPPGRKNQDEGDTDASLGTAAFGGYLGGPRRPLVASLSMHGPSLCPCGWRGCLCLDHFCFQPGPLPLFPAFPASS